MQVLFAARPAVPPDRFVGREVKIAFGLPDGPGENMWVVVTGVRGDALVGYLDNTPVSLKGLRHGERVELKRTQIIAVRPPTDAPRHPPR